MKHTIFLVHGMGVHEKGWEEPYVNAIKVVYEQYEMLAKTPIDKDFEFVPLSYDHIFRGIVETWGNNAQLVADLAAQTKVPVSKLTDWLKGADELKSNFAWSHAADVLLYRGFRLVRERVCTDVANQLIKVVNQQHKDYGKSSWSVVAHSLGTSVIHDTLARIAAPNQNWPGDLVFSTENEQAKVIMMVANVSKVLEVKNIGEPYDAYGSPGASGTFVPSTVSPGFPGQKGRICWYYLTARHKLDFFTIPKMFNPEKWPDDAAERAKPPRYVFTEVDHIHEANVHDFTHYLKHPAVHVPLFRRLTTNEMITDEEYEDALKRFPKFGGLGDDVAFSIRKKLLDKLPATGDSWTELGGIFKVFSKLIQGS